MAKYIACRTIPKDVVFIIIACWGIIAVIILDIVYWPKRAVPMKQRQEHKQVPKRRLNAQSRSSKGKMKRGEVHNGDRKYQRHRTSYYLQL